MGDIVGFLLPAAFGVALGTAAGGVTRKARDRGRGKWMTPVGRPPRDLFANRKVNLFANLIHEWAWIGFSVLVVGFVLLFPVGEAGLYVMGVGLVMILVRGFGTPLCLQYAELSPQYEAEAAAAAAARTA